jgi:hypothetical protein
MTDATIKKAGEQNSKSQNSEEKKPKYEHIDSWLNYIDLKLILFFLWFKPWKLTVIRFVGTERECANSMVQWLNRPYVKPISYTVTSVTTKGKTRYIGTLIYKHK